MGRSRYNHNSFSIGFLSQRIQGNTDFEGYNNALAECVNFVIQPTGGLFKRTGTYFVAEAKSGSPRLVLFSYSAEDQYICEFGAEYIRYFTKYGPLTNAQDQIVETVTTFTIDDVNSMTVQQDGNILILITTKGIFTLTRTAVDTFILEAQEYDTEPLTFTNNEAVALKPSATSGNITITVVDPDNNNQKPAAKYAPFFNDDDVGHFITLSYKEIDADNVIRVKTYYLKILIVSEDTEGFNKVTATVDQDRSYNMQNQLPNTLAVARWQLGAFTVTRGTPKASAFYEGRLFLANNTTYPTGIWGSSKVYMDWTDFYGGENDADALIFKMSSQNADEILWLASQSKLFAGTRWGIYIAGSATYNDEAVTPSNFRIRLFEATGASPLQPVVGMDSVFFVDVSGKKVHEIHLSSETGAYQADDISLLSDDLTQSGIIAHTWQQNPIQTYWCAVEDGHLCSLTYLKNNGIMAWAKHTIMGDNVKIERLCTMHGDKNDLVWMVVRRQIGNEFKRYIEYIHAPYDPLQQEEFKQFYVDSGRTKQLKSSVANITRGSNPQLKIKIDNQTAQQLAEMIPTNDGMFEVAFREISYNMPADITKATAICYGEMLGVYQYVVTQENSNKVARSTDGKAWTVSTMPFVGNWTSICWGADRFVAVAAGTNKAAYSQFGILWTEVTIEDQEVVALGKYVCYGNNTFVMSNYSNYIWYSSDGIEWTKSAALPFPVARICWGGDRFVALGYLNNGTMYSLNGIDWQGGGNRPNSSMPYICYGNGKFVAIGSNVGAYSIDGGLNWTAINLPPHSEGIRDIVYADNKFVAVGSGVSPYNTLVYSTDGIAWTKGFMPFEARAICYGSDKFVAVTSHESWLSNDGINWGKKPWASPKKYYLTNLSIAEEDADRYLVGTLFDYYNPDNQKIAGKIPTNDFALLEENENCEFYLYVSNIFGRNGNNIKCDTRYLLNNDKVLLFDSNIDNYPITGKQLYITDKTANSVQVKYELASNLRPQKGCLFKLISQNIAVLTVAADCTITLEDNIADDAQRVYINKVTGMNQINKQSYKIASISQNRKEITLYDEKTSEICGTDIPLDASNFAPFDEVNPDGNVYVYFSEMGGLEHLEGQTVGVCADGNQRDSRIVNDGKITFEHPVMYCSAGLTVKAWMRTTPFSGGSLLGSSVGAVGGQKSMWLYLYYSLGGRYGAESAKTYPIPYSGLASAFDKPKSLVTGLIKCPIANAKDIYNRSIYIEHSEPVAFNILSITQDIEVSDS